MRFLSYTWNAVAVVPTIQSKFLLNAHFCLHSNLLNIIGVLNNLFDISCNHEIYKLKIYIHFLWNPILQT